MNRLLSLLFIAAACLPVPASTQTATQRLVVRVLDSEGMPVSGLKASDFTLTERGVVRKITWLSPATDPARILLLVDNSQDMQGSLTDLRHGVAAFLDALPFPHEVGFITIGNTPVIRQVPTTDRDVIKGLSGKFTASGRLVLLSAVFEMYDRFLSTASNRWPMFVIVSSDGRDDTRGASEEKFVRVVKDMQTKDVVVHAIMVSPNGKGNGESVQITRALTQATGGVYESISAASALPERLAALSLGIATQHEQISHQYVLDYVGDSMDVNDLKLSVAREGVRVTLSRQGRIR